MVFIYHLDGNIRYLSDVLRIVTEKETRKPYKSFLASCHWWSFINIGGVHGEDLPRTADECLSEICAAAAAGSDCFRIAVPDERALSGIIQLKKYSPLPLIADIHFSPTIALKAVEAGIDGIRVNPGTWKNQLQYHQLIEKLKAGSGVLRLGANAGSLPSHLQKKGRVEALLDSIIEMLEVPQKGFSSHYPFCQINRYK